MDRPTDPITARTTKVAEARSSGSGPPFVVSATGERKAGGEAKEVGYDGGGEDSWRGRGGTGKGEAGSAIRKTLVGPSANTSIATLNGATPSGCRELY